MINKLLINKKVAQIITYLKEIKPLAKLDYYDFINDYKNYRTVERSVQLIIDTAIDINNHIILETNLAPADDYHTSFIRLTQAKVYSPKFAKQIAASAGLRNKLVHIYEVIDLEQLHKDLKNDIKDYYTYIKYIESFLKKVR
jgi:uncharacterized protein YutE (UPF0331/DUF86 family)